MKINIKKLALLVFAGMMLTGSLNVSATVITNASFETGDFSGWVTQDLASPFFALGVAGAGVSPGFGFFSSAPTDGAFSAQHGFDGDGPGTIRVAQDITVVNGLISFDYRGAWDMQSFGGSTTDRLFDVNVETAGGGANLFNQNFLSALAGTQNLDTGILSGTVDLSAFIGQTVRLSFDWYIPQNFTGPGFFELDNITSASAVPEPSVIALFALGLVGIGFARRRREY